MIGTRIGTRAGSRCGGGHLTPAAPTPADLAAALVARWATSPLAGVKLYRDKAGDKASAQYVVFAIQSGSPILTTSTSYWYDQRVRVTAYAATSDAANALREQAWTALAGVPYDFAAGYAIPLFRRNKAEGMETARTVGNSYLFKAHWEASARTCEEV